MITPASVLDRLPEDRRTAMERVLDVIRAHLPPGYEEATASGMIVHQVPLSRYADTYNGQPLWYCAVGSHKNYLSLYLMPAYGSAALAQRLRDGFKAAGKKLDMGKSCIRFQSPDDLALDVVGEIIAAVPLEKWVAIAQAARAGRRSSSRPSKKRASSGRTAKKRAAHKKRAAKKKRAPKRNRS